MSFQNANILIQKFVDNYGNTQRSYRAIDFVRDVSAANVSIQLDPTTFLNAPGKLRQVRVNYFPILCGNEGSCSSSICDTGTVVEPSQTMFTVSRCTATPIYSIQKDDIRMVDYGKWDFTNTALNIIMSAMPNIRHNLALDFVTYLYQLAGLHVDGNTTRRVAVTDTSKGIVNPVGKFDIEREYLDGGFMPPYILGGQEVYYWQNMVKLGGLNAQGQYIDKVGAENAYYDDGLSDKVLNDVTNGGHILTIAPEVFKFITYSKNAGIFRTDMSTIEDFGRLYSNGGDSFLEGTLLDPVTGILWDLYINYDKCTQTWSFQLKLNWDFFVMPDVACNIQGVNGIMHYRTCPPVLAPCPTGDAVPSPASSATYSWTPSISYPVLISQSTIGGVNNTPNVNVTNLDDLVAMMNDAYGAAIFTKSGSSIHYTGYSAITGSFNNGDITFTFA